MEMPMYLKLHQEDIGDIRFSSHVAGTTFISNSQEFLKFLQTRVPRDMLELLMIREPDNENDSNAVRIEVSIKGSDKHKKVGYIPRDKAGLLSYVLSLPEEYRVMVYNIALIGGDDNRSNIGIFFDYSILPIRKSIYS